LHRSVGPDGVVLVTGGGFITDRWPDMLLATIAVLERVHPLPVVLLPQSLHFEDAAVGCAFAAAVAAHGDVTVAVRDHSSLRRAEMLGIAGAVLCPDFAFAVPAAAAPSARPRSATPRVLALRRCDRERSVQPEDALDGRDGADVDRRWVDAGWDRHSIGRLATRTTWRGIARCSPSLASNNAVGRWLLDAQARFNVARGQAVIGESDIVVTDRLHAALLALQLGCEVIAVDSATGKVHDVLETWLPEMDRLHLVPTWASARLVLESRSTE
jgi:pyruvyl transferase EpsO